ncbi:MAG: hypothetical protein MZV64_15410 [Ignavibacteriales bacterium]|nr:hypothetical protein [Ignavibacteriales bacterium]
MATRQTLLPSRRSTEMMPFFSISGCNGFRHFGDIRHQRASIERKHGHLRAQFAEGKRHLQRNHARAHNHQMLRHHLADRTVISFVSVRSFGRPGISIMRGRAPVEMTILSRGEFLRAACCQRHFNLLRRGELRPCLRMKVTFVIWRTSSVSLSRRASRLRITSRKASSGFIPGLKFFARWISVFDGTQPTFVQSPPT